MKPTYSKFLILSLSFAAFAGFQNCSKVNFSRNGSMLTKAGLDGGQEISDGDGGTVITDNGGETPPVTTVDDGSGDETQSSGDMIYICVLKGSGNSHVLQYSAVDHLYNDTSKSHTVCTTERGCLEIASQIFDVDHVKDESGRCTHAKSVIQIDESSLQDLVNAQTQI